MKPLSALKNFKPDPNELYTEDAIDNDFTEKE